MGEKIIVKPCEWRARAIVRVLLRIYKADLENQGKGDNK